MQLELGDAEAKEGPGKRGRAGRRGSFGLRRCEL